MSIKKRKDTEENRAFWNFVEETSKSVEDHFPTWKRGDVDQSNEGLTSHVERGVRKDDAVMDLLDKLAKND